MAKRGLKLKIPLLGKLSLNNKQTWLAAIGLAGLGAITYLAYTGRDTGISFIDKNVDQYGELVEDVTGFNFPGGPMPVVPVAAPPVSIQQADELPLSGAYAVDAPMPYTDWWTTATDEDDRIVVA